MTLSPLIRAAGYLLTLAAGAAGAVIAASLMRSNGTQARHSALVADSIAARADTTHHVQPGLVRRRVVQTGQPTDRVARYAMSATIKPIEITAPGEVRLAPFTIIATPVSVRVEIDTLHLEARLSCGAAGTAGVRAASLDLRGPQWLNVRLDELEQSPDICSPAPRQRIPRFALSRLGLSVGYGAVLAPDGRIVRAPSVGVAWRIWP